MQIKDFKIRCSAIGKIMTNSRSKGEILSQTAKTYCLDWMKGQIYNRRKEISSKYMQKGNEMEDSAIDFIAEKLGLGMLIKNEQFFENDFMNGTPDLILSDCVIDVKNSWDWSTFPLFETEINSDYFYQLQGYMHLTGIKKAKLIYTLMDTPDHLIEREARNYCYQNGIELDVDVWNEFFNKMTYSDVDEKLRIKIFQFDYEPETIEQINTRVIQCREFIKTIKI